jgi:hypothetical protein
MLDEARKLPGGIGAFHRGLAHEGLDGFFMQSFRWTEWYDALHIVKANLVMASMGGVEPEMMARIGGETTARELVPRMFRVLLGLGGLAGAAQHVPWVLPWFFDFGEARVLAATNDSVTVLLSNVPDVLATTYVNAILGFMAGTAELIKRVPATVSCTNVTRTGERDGFARLSLRCTVTQERAPESRRARASSSIFDDATFTDLGGSLDRSSSVTLVESVQHRRPRERLVR